MRWLLTQADSGVNNCLWVGAQFVQDIRRYGFMSFGVKREGEQHVLRPDVVVTFASRPIDSKYDDVFGALRERKVLAQRDDLARPDDRRNLGANGVSRDPE